MLAVIGVMVAAATVVLYTLAVIEFRKPSPPGWTRLLMVEQFVVLAFTAALAASVGLIIKGAVHFAKESAGLIGFEGALILGTIVAAIVAIRVINPGKRLREYAAQTKTEQPVDPTPRAPQSSGSTKRAA